MFWEKLRGELIDIVEWVDDTHDTMVYRFDRYNNEIKNGAQLVVREGQSAVFVNEGRVADVFQPGRHMLTTANLPVLSTLKGWKYGFESPFKAEVYFASTRQFTDLKWGTKHPVMVRDPELGPVRLRAFGTYCLRVLEPAVFIREIVGTDGFFTTGEITEQLRSIIAARFADLIGSGQAPVLDVAGKLNEFAKELEKGIWNEFMAYGLELTKLVIENVSLPPEVERLLDKRTGMGLVGDMGRYAQFQAAEALEKAAMQPGGGAGAGMGMGVGMGAGMAIAQQLGQAFQQQQASAPRPVPRPVQIYVAEDGQTLGPFDDASLREMAIAGRLDAGDFVWANGMPGWLPAGQAELTRHLFAPSTPPAPPPPPPPPPASPPTK